MIPHLFPFELEIKMAEREGNWCLHCNGLLTFQNNTKNLRVTLRQNWKNISFAGKCTHAKPSESGPFYPVHFPHNVTWNLWKTFKAFFSRVINLLLTKLARDRTRRISALGLFCTDHAALGPYCQDLGPIFSQYGPRAWLIRCIYMTTDTQKFDRSWSADEIPTWPSRSLFDIGENTRKKFASPWL